MRLIRLLRVVRIYKKANSAVNKLNDSNDYKRLVNKHKAYQRMKKKNQIEDSKRFASQLDNSIDPPQSLTPPSKNQNSLNVSKIKNSLDQSSLDVSAMSENPAEPSFTDAQMQ